MGRHADQHARSLSDPEGFWGEAATAIHWDTAPTVVLDRVAEPREQWFTDGRLNTCFNALDRWVDGGDGVDEVRPDQAALVHHSPVTDTVRQWTYRELRDEVARLAGALAGLGVGAGDTVVIYMPMVPEAAMAMLACARLGAIHSVVFGGFAPRELAIRIDDARPTVVLSASCGIEGSTVLPYKPLLDAALDRAEHEPDHCVVLQRPQETADLVEGRDRDWADLVAAAEPVNCTSVGATDPLYVLYTSGTTGTPKGVVRDNGSHAVALRWSMPNVYGCGPGDVFWAASDVGWVVGHSYIVYAPLLTGCTTILYEGKPVGTPDAAAFWRVVDDHDVKVLFTAPTAFRAIRKEDPEATLLAEHDTSTLTHLFLAGERTDPNTLEWAQAVLGVPVVDHWWQTETGWPVVANCVGIELVDVKPGSAGLPVPGWDVRVVDVDGNDVAAGETGAIVLRQPLPPGMLPTLWGDDQRFLDSYLTAHPGNYLTGDGGFIDTDGYVSIMGRIDDVINVAGHRLSTGAMEEVVAAHDAVAECAVIGVADDLRGQVPLGLVVLTSGADVDPDELAAELVAAVRADIGAVAVFRRVVIVDRLPKTRSGKILRRTMRAIADGEDYALPSTIDDPAILDELGERLAAPA